MNPRASMPTTASIFLPLRWSANEFTAMRNSRPSCKMGVMSLNRIPLIGKSGTSRTAAFNSSYIVVAHLNGSQRCFYWIGQWKGSLNMMRRGLIPRDGFWPVLFFHHATELGQRNVLDLAHAFARNLELSAHLFERLRLVAVEPEAQVQDFGLTRLEFLQNIPHPLPQRLVAQQFKRGQRILVADDFTKLRRIVVANRRIEAGRADADGSQLRDLRSRDAEHVGQFLVGWLASQSFAELVAGPLHLADLINEMHRQANSLRLVRQGALDRLLDPPRGIGR